MFPIEGWPVISWLVIVGSCSIIMLLV